MLCPLSAVADCETLLFRETTTLGIRRQQQQRSVLAREIVKVSTAYGEIAVKVARSQPGGKVLNRQPEYEDCAKNGAISQRPLAASASSRDRRRQSLMPVVNTSHSWPIVSISL